MGRSGDAAVEHTYSARLVRPFSSVLRATGVVEPAWMDAIDALDVDFRFPVDVAHQMLDTAVSLTGDPDLGLKAARACHPIAAGAINYVINSAPTARGAVEAATRYMSLVNDVLDVSVEVHGARALIRLENRASLSRAARDFQVGSLYRAFSCIWESGAARGARVLFAHAAPERLDEYVATFEGWPIEFGAPCSGFELDAAALDAPLFTAEPRFHAMLVEQAERLLRVPRVSDGFRGRVQRVIASELSAGDASIGRIAEKLHMSSRTLERRLEREGVTFSELHDALRRDLALGHVANLSLELTEIAFLLGFSQTTGFHRAFKRWTGQTPLEYRRGAASARP